MSGKVLNIKKAYFCPSCHTNSVHKWYVIADLLDPLRNEKAYIPVQLVIEGDTLLTLSKCDNCEQISYWHNNKKIYPQAGDNPPPNQYLPDEIQKIYNEANSIANLSDRATRVLLRVALEKLLNYLGVPGDKLYDKIQTLYDPSNQNNLTYQQSDILRILGNDAAHAEKLVNSEEISTEFMFKCINLIARELIELPEETTKLHNIATQSKMNK